MVFLDANPVIYLIEQPASLGPKATARISELVANGERLAVSDLVRMECQVVPILGPGDYVRGRSPWRYRLLGDRADGPTADSSGRLTNRGT